MLKNKAVMIGAGIANMAAAVYLIQEGHWRGEDITFYALDLHGANDGAAASVAAEQYWNKNHPMENTKGYVARGGRMLNYRTYVDLMDLLDRIPSVTEPGMTAAEDTRDFDSKHRTFDKARLMQGGKGIIDGHKLGLNNLDRMLLTRLIMLPDDKEEELDNVSIAEYFKDDPHMFQTNFWYMWETTFAFRVESSAQELRRYMHQMIYEFTQIEHLVGVNRTRYNQFESIMLPLIKYLEGQGCKFVMNSRVEAFDFKETSMQDEITVTGLEILDTATNEKKHVTIDSDTAVFFTNGSITDSASLGDFNTPAPENMDYGAASSLWKQATQHFYNLGNPDKFFADRNASEWVSFTLTTKDHLLLNEITRITTQLPGNALNSFLSTEPITPLGHEDVNMSIVVHHQPHFTTQKPNETVLWGYFLYPRRRGEFVDKQYIKMTGKEMLQELIGQLSKVDPGPVNIKEKEAAIMDSVINCIPVYMPYASALFNNRAKSDRPEVIPTHSTNLAFTGEFVEQPYQMVFTEQSAVRSGEIAAYHFAGIPESQLVKTPRYDKDPRVLLRAAKRMFE
ncbi:MULTISPECIES: oleate hydratase [Ligilactobacillus]|jgi:oleate hydratase|uniref:9,9'-di-cis-zeta-carotene desaturase, zds n=1 Tax=Ligilactobacillus animalis TaxID=1605 RepID=A0AAJ6FMG7_9LACO|nr:MULTISPECIES: oleate hydratase [Ligilactobacillus]KDA45857.1 9,9'-di-cis-zeta-carotene desaturase, zds [Ligilactobacillus animalis]MCI5942807.1 oleate hydratase [Ligilactobacillus animalis]MDO5882744.1 oleate hydratase [Ligilactobacillus animalis]MDQ2233552.1 oleate hydratase [Ligilactobacillus animalis]MDU1488313.1 oleate hydratase [Ligilactobacillus animalis]